MIGQTISHYEITEKLGEGGMGVVYKAEDTRLHRSVAIKFLRPDVISGEDAKRRFLHEAQAAGALDHPNVCTIYEIDEAQERLFLAMAYVEGETLKQKIERRPLPLEEALDIALQIGQGLQAAHRKQIFHRDIKSANIMVTAEGLVKIMDFGLAQLGGQTRITRTGASVGTPGYMSPEQVRGQAVDGRTDIWSLGAVLYEMIAGQSPFGGEVEQAVMYSIVNVDPEPLTGRRTGVPISLDRAVAKALAKDVEDRYQHIDELLVDLRGVRRELATGGRPQPQETPFPRVEFSPGQMLGHYRLEAALGEGGMGVVYRALDTRLDRSVAIKVLHGRATADQERRRRFVREAKAASALNHPNIVTIHDVGEAGGVNYIVMELIDGQTLDRVIGSQGLAVPEALQYAVPLADALAKAHATGIVHRDIKPGNIMVRSDGLVKILDFGLAKLTETAREEAIARLRSRELPQTGEGQVLGTIAYMSPEQAEGKPVDTRSDIFSFGTVLYEMLSGHRPFQGNSELSTLISILRDSPAPIEKARPNVPRALGRILCRCLEKNLDARYPSAAELARDLETCQTRVAAVRADYGALLRRPRVVLAGLLVVLVAVAGLTWTGVRRSRERWARNEALPGIARLAEEGQNGAAFRLARQAGPYLAGDPGFTRLWDDISTQVAVESTPPGADVSVRDYLSREDDWMSLGQTPLKNITLPRAFLRWRVSKPGFATIYKAYTPEGPSSFKLDAESSVPEGMVRVPSGTLPQTSISGFGSLGPYPIEHYFIDRCEVTSKQYQAFVDGGGYQKREYWKNEFVKDGRVLSWEEAMAGFRDATGRPGPATWEAGRYPAGRDNFPVAGVSWYEAAAYAEFAGKSLPTIYHWLWAAGLAASPYIVPLSNFGTDGPAAVASYKGIGPFGTYDMAGNVKEWCWNETKGLRFILGGAWDEATYMFSNADARSPFDRSATNGFRCASYPTAIPDRLTGPRQREFRDYGKERPASDELFRVFARQYAYDRRELNAVLVSVDESQESWRKQKIAFDAAYGGERVTAYLFLPKNLRPPYQTVVFFPGSGVLLAESSEHLVGMNLLDYIIKSGRAVLYPVYQETYERRPKSWEPAMGTTAGRSLVHRRDRIVMWYKDLARSIDYLETRADVDRAKLAFLGHSMGAADGPIFCALEPRLKVCILQVGGLYQRETLPEVDAFHFAPRVKVPTLMLNGREDFIFPLESSQLPLYRLLGTPAEHKRHVVLEAAHDLGAQRTRVVREVLDWLDRYLGPIR